MKTSSRHSQQGLAHVALIVIIVAVLAVVGFAGWKIASSHKSHDTAATASDSPLSRAAILASCTETDKNICKFEASWKSQPYYTIDTKTTADGQTTEATYQAVGTSKYHMKTTGDTPYEIIAIDKTTYTRAADGTWWKQAASASDDSTKYKQSFDFDNSDNSSSDTTAKVTYKNLGTEACGKLTCYKYQVVDSSAPDNTEYIWFDTKDYQLRRTLDTAQDGSVTDSTFSYDKISIDVPHPVKELGPNQYIVPGQSQPTTLPTAPDSAQAQDQTIAPVDDVSDQ